VRPTSERVAGTQSCAITVDVTVTVTDARLAGELCVPAEPRGLVVFAHGSGSGRNSPRNRTVAAALQDRGYATLLFDLLSAAEQETAAEQPSAFDVDVLGHRVRDAVAWARGHPAVAGLPVGLYGASTGGAVALWAAAEPASPVAAVVCRGGRPDLARARLAWVSAPTLLVVGGRDGYVEDLNRRMLPLLHCEAQLTVVHGAGHLFDQPGALATVARLAADWFDRHLTVGDSRPPARRRRRSAAPTTSRAPLRPRA
jgi:dienelactone hydrolase